MCGRGSTNDVALRLASSAPVPLVVDTHPAFAGKQSMCGRGPTNDVVCVW